MKPGHTRFFVGYKKHTLRLWIGGFEAFVLLVPLVTWATPASVPESYLLKPSVRYCLQRLEFHPDLVVGDMGYIHQATKRELRTRWNVAVMTKLKADMQAHCAYAPEQPLRCPQGEELMWLGYEVPSGQHWFGPHSPAQLCVSCWERSTCPGEFPVPADTHETFFGMIPLNTKLAHRLVCGVRSWIEASQSFEKNQLGLSRVFLNSLHLCWTSCLLADSAALLRTLALLKKPTATPLLHELFAKQTQLPLE